MVRETETRILKTAGRPIEARMDDEGDRRLVGYGAVFDSLSEDLGGFRETITPDAFTRTVSLDNDVLVTMNHNVDLLLGRTGAATARIGVDAIGVFYDVDLPDTSAGRDVWALAQRGDLAGSSFTFTVAPDGDRWGTDSEGRRVRELTEVRLIELGPVASPAYLETSVAARSLAAFNELEERSDEVVEVAPDMAPEVAPEADAEGAQRWPVRLRAIG